MLLTPALQEARLRGAESFPVLRVDWLARGLDLGRGIYSPSMRHTDAGQVSAITKKGGWGDISYGSGIDKAELRAVETTVSVIDREDELLQMLDTYDPRGSEASIDWAAPGLVVEDWFPLFRGVVADYGKDGPHTDLYLKTDDTVLRRPVPAGTILRTEWGSADEGSIFGTYLHLVTGVHDSWQITARGMVRAPNIRYDENLGYWYLASVGNLVDIRRIAYDGIQQGDAGWSVRRAVFGQNLMTIIVVAPGFQPSKGVVVSFDCEGPDEDGLATGATLTGAPDQLRAIINEYGFRTAPLAGWRGDSPLIHPESWDAVSAYFALHKIEAARTIGGEQEPETLADVIESFLKSYQTTRIQWNELGQLEIGVLDPDDVEPESAEVLNISKHSKQGVLPLSPGDRKEVYTHVRMAITYASGEQKFLSAYEAHDVAALPEKLVYPIENVWSQGRLTQDTALNPAAPADPEIPT